MKKPALFALICLHSFFVYCMEGQQITFNEQLDKLESMLEESDQMLEQLATSKANRLDDNKVKFLKKLILNFTKQSDESLLEQRFRQHAQAMKEYGVEIFTPDRIPTEQELQRCLQIQTQLDLQMAKMEQLNLLEKANFMRPGVSIHISNPG